MRGARTAEGTASGDVHRPLAGVLLMFGAAALLPVMDGLAKYLSETYPLMQVIWARYFFHLLTMLPLLLLRYGPQVLWPQRPAVQLLRGALLLGATMLFFSAISRMPLATALSLFFVSPLVVTGLAPFLLRETVGWRRWLAVLVGFAGALIVMRPGTDSFEMTGLLAVAAGVVHGLYLLTTRKLSGSAPPLVTLAYTALVGAVGMSVVVLFYWQPPTPAIFGLMVLMGLFAAAGHLMVIRALDFAPASLLAPAAYFEIITATIVGLVVFGDFPDAWTWVGMAVIAGSGIFISLRERKPSSRVDAQLPS
ncbi:MAG: DMT family transporter [Trueperaceae bacterium]